MACARVYADGRTLVTRRGRVAAAAGACWERDFTEIQRNVQDLGGS